jgi:magnesium chelatase accessory protein
MMARWDLHGLQADFPAFSRPLTLVAGDHDLAVPPQVAERVHAIIPHSRLIRLPGLGHLAHEESPDRVVEIVRAAVDAWPDPG